MNKRTKLFIAVVFCMAIFVLLIYSYRESYRSGIKHAVEQSRITVESNEVFIELDGQLYVHTAN